jgi:outer membrane protein assembly factor BamE
LGLIGNIFMRFWIVFLTLFLTACSPAALITPYKINVQQGNVVTQDMLDKIKPGMTKSQVRFALGTPLISDPFHGERWDYVYRFNKEGRLTEERKLTVEFEGDKLKEVTGTALPPSDKIAGTRRAELIMPDSTPVETKLAAAAPASTQTDSQAPAAGEPKSDAQSVAAGSVPSAEAEPAAKIIEIQPKKPKRSMGERFLRLFGLGKKDEVQQAKAEEKLEGKPETQAEPEAEAEPVTNTVVNADRSPPPKRSVGERFMRLIGLREKDGDDPSPPVTTETQNRLPRLSSLSLKELVVEQILGFGGDKEKEKKAAAEDIEPGEKGVAEDGRKRSVKERFMRLIGIGNDEEEAAPAKSAPAPQTAEPAKK